MFQQGQVTLTKLLWYGNTCYGFKSIDPLYSCCVQRESKISSLLTNLFGQITNCDYYIFSALSKDYNTLMSAMKKTYPSKYARCHDTNDLSKPCLCHYQMCVGWYPCGLKYCRGKDSAGKVVSYRCGIKTCRRCLVFEHVARQRLWCLWDDS